MDTTSNPPESVSKKLTGDLTVIPRGAALSVGTGFITSARSPEMNRIRGAMLQDMLKKGGTTGYNLVLVQGEFFYANFGTERCDDNWTKSG